MNPSIALIGEELDRYLNVHLGPGWRVDRVSQEWIATTTTGQFVQGISDYAPGVVHVTIRHSSMLASEAKGSTFALALQRAVEIIEEQERRMNGGRA